MDSENQGSSVTPISDERSIGFANVWIDEEEARAMIHRFQGDHYPKLNRLSKSVWISKQSFLYLAQHLDQSVDGVRIYLAAYDKKVVPSQKYDTQATIIIVPTQGKKDAFNHIPKPKEYVLNHGDLCPNSCTDTIW